MIAALWLAVAAADVRLMNATGKPLTIDLATETEQIRDQRLAPGKTFTDPLGTPMDGIAYHTLVVRDEEGKELARERLVSRGNYAIVNWGDGVSIRSAGNFRGRSASVNRVGLINAAGEVLSYRLAYPDLQVSEGKTRDLRDEHAITYVAVGRHASPGSKVGLKVDAAAASPASLEVETGGLYLVKKAAGALKIEPVYVP